MSRSFFLSGESVLRFKRRPSQAVLFLVVIPAKRDGFVIRAFRSASVYRAVGRINQMLTVLHQQLKAACRIS